MLNWAGTIIANNLLLVLLFILIPVIGRVVQTNGFGTIGKPTYWLLEIPVEGTRFLFLLLLVGNGKIIQGLEALSSVFRMSKEQWKSVTATVIKNLKLFSTELLATALVFVLVAIALNYLIKYAASRELLLVKLKQFTLLKYLNSQSLTLFLKNLSVIPLTIIFEIWLILRLLNKT